MLHYYGRRWYIFFQVVYNLSMQASNVAAMIISAQVVDQFCRDVIGGSYALDYQNYPPKFVKMIRDPEANWCSLVGPDGLCEPDHKLTFVISIGFVVCMTICIPFGYLNLDDNMWFQWVSLVGLRESAFFLRSSMGVRCSWSAGRLPPGTALYLTMSGLLLTHSPARGWQSSSPGSFSFNG